VRSYQSMTQQQSCWVFSGVSLPNAAVGPPPPRPPAKPPPRPTPSPPPPPAAANSSSTRLTHDESWLRKCRLSPAGWCCLPKWIFIVERSEVRVLGRVDATRAVRLQRATVAADQPVKLLERTSFVLAVGLELAESRQLRAS